MKSKLLATVHGPGTVFTIVNFGGELSMQVGEYRVKWSTVERAFHTSSRDYRLLSHSNFVATLKR